MLDYWLVIYLPTNINLQNSYHIIYTSAKYPERLMAVTLNSNVSKVCIVRKLAP